MVPRGLHLVKPCHSTFVHGIWNNTPIFKKYWKIPPKIVFFNPLPIWFPNLKKPLFSLYIACIHFYIYIFYTPLYFYLVYWPHQRKLAVALRKIMGSVAQRSSTKGNYLYNRVRHLRWCENWECKHHPIWVLFYDFRYNAPTLMEKNGIYVCLSFKFGVKFLDK